MPPAAPGCPVCGARFRGARQCTRCGADLTCLMALATTAWNLREAARRALTEDAPARARELAESAQTLQPTPEGRRLSLLAAWLAGGDKPGTP